MSKRIVSLCIVLLMSAVFIGCAKPPYDARAIDQSEIDSPAQPQPTPAAGGGKALKDSDW